MGQERRVSFHCGDFFFRLGSKRSSPSDPRKCLCKREGSAALRLGLGYPQPLTLARHPPSPRGLGEGLHPQALSGLSGHLLAGGGANGEEGLMPGIKGHVAGNFAFRDFP